VPRLTGMPRDDARAAVLATFRWVDGHADVWRLFHDGPTFSRVVDALAEVAFGARATKVGGIESRGFVLGAAVAARTGLGFVAIRKAGGLFPGTKAELIADADYRGQAHLLQLQRDAITDADRVVLVDDWAELGSQASAARRLVEDCGATWAGLALIVDQLSPPRRSELSPVSSIVSRTELPACP
jgi:adenine phosphoribosyltransferase